MTLGASPGALPVLRVGGNVGFSWSRANAEYWRHDGPEAALGETVLLPLGFTLGARASIRWKDYQGEGFAHLTIDREPREDKTAAYYIILTHGLLRGNSSPDERGKRGAEEDAMPEHAVACAPEKRACMADHDTT